MDKVLCKYIQAYRDVYIDIILKFLEEYASHFKINFIKWLNIS
jgi:hypothetical protein